VVSPNLTPALANLAARRAVIHLARRYLSGDLAGVFLVYVATDNDAVQRQVADDARQAGVLVNVVDRPELCDFISPSVVRRGDLLIAASTSGASPALAKRIRQDLESRFGLEYDVALQLLRRLRVRLPRDRSQRRRIFTALIDSPLLDYLRSRQGDQVDRLLASTVGADVSLSSLGMELPNA
jgi:precorrin-2 dehydrogenase/sirohydrochlorin ferrochelatase